MQNVCRMLLKMEGLFMYWIDFSYLQNLSSQVVSAVLIVASKKKSAFINFIKNIFDNIYFLFMYFLLYFLTYF